jgi:hypothetical protein
MTRKIIASGPIHGPVVEKYEQQGNGSAGKKGLVVFISPTEKNGDFNVARARRRYAVQT